MKQKFFWLPLSQKLTKNFSLYVREWNKIIKPMEKMTGLKCTSFDPDICLQKFIEGQYDNNGYVQIPLWFAKILLKIK